MSDWWTEKVRWFASSMALYDRQPVYHMARPFDAAEIVFAEDGTRLLTTRRFVCGRILTRYGEGRALKEATAILREHAEKIGRPCKQCFR